MNLIQQVEAAMEAFGGKEREFMLACAALNWPAILAAAKLADGVVIEEVNGFELARALKRDLAAYRAAIKEKP